MSEQNENKRLEPSESAEKRHLTSAERQKLYEERATQKRISEYRKRKKAKAIRITLIVVGAILLIAAISSLLVVNKKVWEPARVYNSACDLFASEEYLDAYSVFISLGYYKDAPELAKECITKNAQKLSGREDVIIGTSASMPWFKIDEHGAIFFDEDVYNGPSTITIPDVFNNALVMAIGDKAFFYAEYLTEIILPPSIIRLEPQAFFACTGIKSMTLPDSVEYIGEKAFGACSSLEKIDLSDNLTEIASFAFNNARALKTIVLPESLEILGARAFSACEKLESAVIPDGIKALPNGLFSGCTALKSVTFPSELNSIGSSVFDSCENLQSISIPEGVKSIGADAFNLCKALSELTLPSSLEEIGNFAFAGCEKLAKVRYNGSLDSLKALCSGDGNDIVLKSKEIICSQE